MSVLLAFLLATLVTCCVNFGIKNKGLQQIETQISLKFMMPDSFECFGVGGRSAVVVDVIPSLLISISHMQCKSNCQHLKENEC
jgi:hypothetical protein